MDAQDRLRERFTVSTATVAFVDLAGFSAIADVYGDVSAIGVLERFEAIVADALEGLAPPIKWIGDEAMFDLPDPETALRFLGRLLPACRADASIPLTRTGLNHGPVIRRASDLFGSTVNVAARMTAVAEPGQLLAGKPIGAVAAALGIATRDLGAVALRSVAEPMHLCAIELAQPSEPAWIDPVCKMHAPFSAYSRAKPEGPWFCSERCELAYRRSPEAYRQSL